MAGHRRRAGSEWGRVVVGRPAAAALSRGRGSSVRVQRARYTWHPPPDVAAELPPGFKIEFDCFTDPDGVRRFTPRDVAAFLLWASLGGHAILLSRYGSTPEQRSSYGATRLLYQKGPGLREHLTRTFTRESDLYVTQAERADG